jgi:flagellar assembly protein FliH
LSNIVKSRYLTNVHTSWDTQASNRGKGQSRKDDVDLRAPRADENRQVMLDRVEQKIRHFENQARQRAEDIIDSAMRSSREILEEAESKGYEEGLRKGMEEGIRNAEEAAEEGIREIQSLIETINREHQSLLERKTGELIDIAFGLAEKIMKQHVKVDEDAIQRMMEEIMAENEEAVKIYFSEHQKTLEARVDKDIAKKLREQMKDAKLVLIQGEDLIAVENQGGIVDMSIPVQLAQLKKAVDHVSKNS